MKTKITKTLWGSWFTNSLSKGCQQCIKGEKLVVLVTTECKSNCYYCPLSIERKESTYAYANERPIKQHSDLVIEANLMEAKGASMTGGDPLEEHSISQTIEYCQILREISPKDFHTHIYTRGKELTPGLLSELSPIVDEIRFHVINLQEDLKKVKLATQYDLDVGIEVPIIPSKRIDYYTKLITKFEKILPVTDNFYFMNLNELEVSETNYRNLLKHNLKWDPKNYSAIEGSAELGRDIITWASKNSRIPVHFCALSTKDTIQLTNRLYRIAKNVKLPSDVVIQEGPDKGLLLRGVIQSDSTDLESLRRVLITRFQIPEELISLDREKQRLLTNAALLSEYKEKIKSMGISDLILGIAEEYPTYDRLQTTFIPFD